MFSDVYHIGYLTDDMAAAIGFYRSIFGAEVKKETLGPDGKTKMAFVRVGSTEVELIEPSDKSRLNGRTGLIIDHVGYVVGDIDAEMKKLAARGIKFAAAAPHVNAEGARLIYLDAETTQGARVHLTERPT